MRAIPTTTAAAILLFAVGAGAVRGAPERAAPFLADYRGQTTQNDGKHFAVEMLVERSKHEIFALLIKEYTCPDGPFHFLKHGVRLSSQGAFRIAPPVSQHLHMTEVKGRLSGTRITGSFVASRRGCRTAANFVAVLGGGAPVPPRPGAPAVSKPKPKPRPQPYATGSYGAGVGAGVPISFSVVRDAAVQGFVRNLQFTTRLSCDTGPPWYEDVTERLAAPVPITGTRFSIETSSESGDAVTLEGSLKGSTASGSLFVSRQREAATCHTGYERGGHPIDWWARKT